MLGLSRLLLMLAAVLPLALASAPVTTEHAVEIAADFALRRPTRRHGPRHKARRAMRPARTPSGRTRTYAEGGTNLFHLVSLDGGGFVAVAADDESSAQVLGFSTSGELPDASAENPFWRLVGADARAARSRRGRKGDASLKAASGADAVDDVRVAPLVKSKWNQTTVGGKKVYNYYVPNGYTCGCVATALAQLIRFHEYPSGYVTPKTFTCYVGTSQTQTNLTMVGGTYDWSLMPFVPTSSITDDEREMIGRLCYDAGVSMRMNYGFGDGGSSGALGGFEIEPLKSVFGYANAESYMLRSGSLSSSVIKAAILANLDAGYPVLLGIQGDGGHAIVADGYGYIEGTLYTHLNMGWSGSSDFWYALPDIGTKYNFNVVDSVTYNIFPTKTGQLVTGRVTDPFGDPVQGATVNASIKYDHSSEAASTTTNENGIYAIFAKAGKSCSVTVSVSYGGLTSDSISTLTKASKSPTGIDFETGDAYLYGLRVGNSWGNNFTIGSANGETPAVAELSPTTESASGDSLLSLSLSGTAGSWYLVERTYNLSDPQWEAIESFMIPSSGATAVDIPVEIGVDNAFFRIVPK